MVALRRRLQSAQYPELPLSQIRIPPGDGFTIITKLYVFLRKEQ